MIIDRKTLGTPFNCGVKVWGFSNLRTKAKVFIIHFRKCLTDRVNFAKKFKRFIVILNNDKIYNSCCCSFFDRFVLGKNY